MPTSWVFLALPIRAEMNCTGRMYDCDGPPCASQVLLLPFVCQLNLVLSDTLFIYPSLNRAESSVRTNSCSSGEEKLRILWALNCHYRVYDSPPLVPVMYQMNPFHILPSCFLDIDIVSSHLCPRIPSGLLPLGFHAKTACAFSVHAC